MNKPHKHAAIIKAWADGADIQWFDDVHGLWRDWPKSPAHTWSEDRQYRVKSKPLEWQVERDAYAAGKKIQYRSNIVPFWVDLTTKPLWMSNTMGGTEYRVKPEPVVQKWYVDPGEHLHTPSHLKQNLQLTFEDGKLVKAEVL